MPFQVPVARRLLVLFAVLGASLALTTSTAAQRPTAADSIRLNQRMTALHRAIAAKDGAGWYALTAVAFRNAMTLDEFKADLGLDSVPPTQPRPDVRVALERMCRCGESPRNDGAIRCVAIVKATSDSLPAGDERWLETWDFVAKEWYWGYGEPIDPRGKPPRCPSGS